MKKLKMGVLGLGGISSGHTNTYINNPNTELYAVCDISGSWLKYRADQLNVSHAYTDYRELLENPEIDAVSVCLPNKYHADASICALNAGKHVLCEKPMALNAGEAEAMLEASVKNNKKLMVSQNDRFTLPVQLMRKKMEEGFFGDIYFARIGCRRKLGIMPEQDAVRENGEHYSRNWFNEKAMGGGVLRDLGSHHIDSFMYINGFVPNLVSADASCYRKFYVPGYDGSYVCDSEDLATAHLKFDTGLTVHLEESFGCMIENHVVLFELYGTKGGASFRGGDFNVMTLTKDAGGVCESEKIEKYDFTSKSPQERFIDALVNDTEVPVNPEHSVKVIKILDAIYKSAGEVKK